MINTFLIKQGLYDRHIKALDRAYIKIMQEAIESVDVKIRPPVKFEPIGEYNAKENKEETNYH